MGYSETEEPTVCMADDFTAFMFKTRQLRSREGRAGLGDSAPSA